MSFEIIEALLAPLSYPLDPSRRIFVGFLASSCLLAVIISLFTHRQSLLAGLRKLFSPSLWLHPSSLVDMQMLLLNSILRALLITPFIVGKMSVIILTAATLRDLFGDFNDFGYFSGPEISGSLQNGYSHGLIVLLFTITLFVAEDFSRFAQHWLMHHIPWLWRIHQVHHSAEVLTPLTLYRLHPLEMFISSWRGILVLGTVTGLFVYLFPGQLSALEILGVDALGFLFNAMGANLRHSPVSLSFGPLSKVFISPVMHQIHHSSDPAHRNKNFGSCLSLWDRLAGCYLPGTMGQALDFGLQSRHKERDNNPRLQNCVVQYISPFCSAKNLQLLFKGCHSKKGLHLSR